MIGRIWGVAAGAAGYLLMSYAGRGVVTPLDVADGLSIAAMIAAAGWLVRRCHRASDEARIEAGIVRGVGRALGMSDDQARDHLAFARGESEGDVIEIDPRETSK